MLKKNRDNNGKFVSNSNSMDEFSREDNENAYFEYFPQVKIQNL